MSGETQGVSGASNGGYDVPPQDLDGDGVPDDVAAGDLEGLSPTPGMTFASNNVRLMLSNYLGRKLGIGAPSDGSSNDDWELLMLDMTNQTEEQMAKTTQEGLNGNQKKLEVEQARQIKQTQDWHHQCMKAKHHSKWGKVLGWAMKIGACLLAAGAIALSGLTLGAATPLAVAALAFATYAFAAQVVSVATGKDIGAESNLMKGIVMGLKKAGVSDKNAMIAGIVIQGVLMIAAMIASGRMGGSAEKLTGMTKALLQYGSKAMMGAQIAQGSVTAAHGGVDLQVADDQHAAGELQAQSQYTEAGMTDLKAVQQQLMEAAKLILDLMAAAVQAFSGILASRQASGDQLIHAMAPTRISG